MDFALMVWKKVKKMNHINAALLYWERIMDRIKNRVGGRPLFEPPWRAGF
jgi:hypothetical protein